ncbi:J domain-containing protein [Bradyrhizobium sp. AUGA SZCCT0283]|jgi:curved DNA-binding protein CbpA|uniref:J domain-containing protein n=1 Tax=Bradyrhizobium sp. AUGA SZCCT0283 TaxID=2807671 RepID=UPI001BAD98B4|nr:J domain-containing protein [Bradyrhizobium sp. AUGA SZCCT0283]MBR1278560.1 J domain-containing protein [Bradyrhizobium sp. AUGA SZCCT0283]
MGTLYDLLGALPSDDAEGLRTAFRKAAKATHPDINPDNPDAALRFRELVRAYDILSDAEQRTTYDQLLAIALQPPATKATRTYENMRKVASNTMAATVISAVLVGGYTLFGLFSKPPGAAEMVTDRTAGGTLEVAALQPEAPARDEPRVQREGEATTGAAVTMAAAAPAAKEAGAAPIGRFEPVPGFATYNLGVQYYPRFAAAYFDRGVVLYRIGDFDRPLADIASAKRPTDLKRTKTATPVPRKPLMIVPPVPERREPLTAALTN